jgi:hypothetical protein
MKQIHSAQTTNASDRQPVRVIPKRVIRGLPGCNSRATRSVLSNKNLSPGTPRGRGSKRHVCDSPPRFHYSTPLHSATNWIITCIVVACHSREDGLMKRLIVTASLLVFAAGLSLAAGAHSGRTHKSPPASLTDATRIEYHGNSSHSSAGRLYFPRTASQPVKRSKAHLPQWLPSQRWKFL